MSYFIRDGDAYRVAPESSMNLCKTLPVGNYVVQLTMSGFILEIVDDFPTLPKIYGNITKNADRILSTFLDRSMSTGVILSGEKGSGKTLLAKVLSQQARKQGIPTLMVNQPLGGDNFSTFLQEIEQPCVVLFDEFEKTYDLEQQESILTLLDGVFPSKKLFIITCNNKWRINEHMRNRPGRVYYMLEFSGLQIEFIRGYCEDNLKNKEHIDKICDVASLFHQFNFDMLKALVEEMNRYDETPQEALVMLNVKPEYNDDASFDVSLVIGSRDLTKTLTESGCSKWSGKPLLEPVNIEWLDKLEPTKKGKKKRTIDDIECDDDDDFNMWVTSIFLPSHIKKIDPQEGRFTYVNEKNEVLTLTKQKSTTYSYFGQPVNGSSEDDDDY